MNSLSILNAVIVLLLGLVIGKILGRLIIKTLHEIDTNKMLGKIRISYNIEAFIGNITSLGIYVYSFYLSLKSLGVANIFIYMIGSIILLLIGISFLLTVKDFIPNLFAGFIVRKKLKCRIGTKFHLGNLDGVIEKITSHDIRLRTSQGDLIFIPYSTILKKSND